MVANLLVVVFFATFMVIECGHEYHVLTPTGEIISSLDSLEMLNAIEEHYPELMSSVELKGRLGVMTDTYINDLPKSSETIDYTSAERVELLGNFLKGMKADSIKITQEFLSERTGSEVIRIVQT